MEEYMNLQELERERLNRGISTGLNEAREAGLLPRSQRIARKSGGVGSTAGYHVKTLDYLALIDELRSQGLSLPVVRKKLSELVERGSIVIEKKEEAKALLQEALTITGDDEKRASLLVKALSALEDISIDEGLLFEAELAQFDNLENKLRYLLSKNPPAQLRDWKRGQG